MFLCSHKNTEEKQFPHLCEDVFESFILIFVRQPPPPQLPAPLPQSHLSGLRSSSARSGVATFEVAPYQVSVLNELLKRR